MEIGIVFFVIGIFSVVGTYMKPRFYWESRKARRLRNLIGDRGAEIVYYILGAVFIGIGVLSFLNIISLK